MCNACHNMCCGSDEFGGCGCDGCDEPECWSPEDEDFDEAADYDDPYMSSCCARPAAINCEAVAA